MKALPAAVAAAGAAAVGWAGFRITPRPFPPPPPGSPDEPLRAAPDLPHPIAGHLRAVYGGDLPAVETLTMWGTGRMRPLPGPWWPMRGKTCHVIGRRFAGHFHASWWGIPLLRAVESHELGTGRSYLPWGVATGPGLDQSSLALMWVEAGLYATNPAAHGAHWKPIDACSARLVVSRQDGEEVEIVARTDPESGLVRSIETERSRGPNEEPEPWRADIPGWHGYRGVLAPDLVAVTWERDGDPWLEFAVTGTAVNVDLTGWFPDPTGARA